MGQMDEAGVGEGAQNEPFGQKPQDMVVRFSA
jgi:hypothetical protein